MFQAYYEKVLLPDSSPAKIAWIGSFQMFGTFFMCLATTPLINKGYFRHCLVGGSLLFLGGLGLLSVSTKWWQLMLVQGVMMGIGGGLAFSSGVIALTSYFSTRLGVATAIAATGSSMGRILRQD
jgi:MFS family permease